MAAMLVRCTVCDRMQTTDHGASLEGGWPKCCGYTMLLESTREFIEAIKSRRIPHLSSQDRSQ